MAPMATEMNIINSEVKEPQSRRSSIKQSKITLVSGDGARIELPRTIACQSPVLNMFVDEKLGWNESRTGEIVLRDVSGKLLERVCKYLSYKHGVERTGTTELIPFEVGEEEAADLLMVADYLEI